MSSEITNNNITPISDSDKQKSTDISSNDTNTDKPNNTVKRKKPNKLKKADNIHETFTSDVSDHSNNTKNQKRSYGKIMSLDMCENFYCDSYTLTLSEMQEKYSEYGKIDTADALCKKRWSISKRLKNANRL